MSYSNTFQDYLRDIPMEIGRKFYPPPLINLPTLTLPEPSKGIQYAFEAEKRARQQFDEANNVKSDPKFENPPVNGVASSDLQSSASTPITNELLLPCAAPPATTSSPQTPIPAPKPVSFEEFEGRGTVFDEVEWRSIDDKLALSQILGNVSLQASKSVDSAVMYSGTNQEPPHSLTNGSKSVAIPAIPPYPVLEFGRSKSEEPAVMLSAVGEVPTAVYKKPSQSASVKEMSSAVVHDSPLRVRLLTKGYRPNLVNVALERLPRERLPYVEYYMKGMSILEKRGVEVEKTVTFLLDSNLSEKQEVVKRAQTADQLLGMGFSADEVFSALLNSQGDRVKALDTLLGAR
uniref:UBA domain-containing protein n=1 Tax=Haemonchus contortus TaxID=6289 RepID=A0A7I4XT64_HAECO